MADQQQVIRGINWRELFPFTHLFRAFRISVQLSKIGLALAALIILYCGGMLFDAAWPTRYRALPGEIQEYNQAPSGRAFTAWRQAERKQSATVYAGQLLELKKVKPGEQMVEVRDLDRAIEAAESGRYAADLRYWYKSRLRGEVEAAKAAGAKALKSAEDEYQAALKKLEETKRTADEERRIRGKAVEQIEKTREAAINRAYATAEQGMQIIEDNRGQGLFRAFFHYQAIQLGGVVNAVVANNWSGGIGPRNDPPGVVVCLVRYFTVAPAWAVRHHIFYFVLYGALFLAVWSLFGGAIARIAAVHVADEGRKLSFRQGLEFAIHKFLSFFSAPLIPIFIVTAIGLVIALVAGLLMLIPYLGEILVGVGLLLALIGGFVIALVILGAAGGFNLMFPTIAVEGSDSFDAISRSFSYVFARPWRMLFYTAVSVAYGSVCYLFVRVVIWLVLVSTHFSVGLFVGRDADNGMGLWEVIWPRPELGSFTSSLNTLSLTWAGCTSAFFVQVWMHLIVFVLGAFAISFYFCSNTIIYYLLRKDVDTTEMDDVFIEETEEDFIDRAGTTAPAAAAPVTAAPEASAPVSVPEAKPAESPVVPLGVPTPVETPAPPAAPESPAADEPESPAADEPAPPEERPNPPV